MFTGLYQEQLSQEGVEAAVVDEHIKTFRNEHIAHGNASFGDAEQAKVELRNWISGLAALHRAHEMAG